MTGRSFHEYSTLYLHWIFASIPVTIIKSVQGSRFDWEWYGQIERVVYWLEVFVQLHTVAADLHPSSYWHNIDWLMISSPPPRSTDWLTPQWSVCWSVETFLPASNWGILSATSTRESKNFENWIGIKSESQSAATGPGKVTPPSSPLCSGLVCSVNFNRIIPGITAGILLQRKTLEKLGVGSVPVLPRTIFCFQQKKLTSDPL